VSHNISFEIVRSHNIHFCSDVNITPTTDSTAIEVLKQVCYTQCMISNLFSFGVLFIVVAGMLGLIGEPIGFLVLIGWLMLGTLIPPATELPVQ
jgi:hypothetical protein